MKVIIDNAELIVLVAASVFILGMNIFGFRFSIGINLSIITAFLALLALNSARLHHERQSEREKTRQDREVLKDIRVLLKSHRPPIELVAPRERPDIWSEFEGVYYAWNAPFRLERDTDLEKSLETHIQRYRNTNFIKAKYFFFYGENSQHPDHKVFKRRFENYRRFVSTLSSQCPEVQEKLETYIIPERLPGYTFFIGRRKDSDLCILYFNIEPFMSGDMPEWAFLIKEPSIIKSLRSQFDKKVYECNALGIQDVLKGDIESCAGLK
jgi:hypothetical protein